MRHSRVRSATPSILLLGLLALVLALGPARSAGADETPPKLLGPVTRADLAQAPYASWFDEGYRNYSPDIEVVEALRRHDWTELRFTVFFGTWCGDSRREVPRLLKLLSELGVSEASIQLIAVDNEEALHKRSPGGEEVGFEVYRVPTLVVERVTSDAEGRELGRWVEHPVRSLERDLLAILDGGHYEDGSAYQPSYATYEVVRRWLTDGLLSDPNVSAGGLAQQVRALASSEAELYSAARVLLLRGDITEAVKLFEVNAALYRDSATAHERLASAQLLSGQSREARASALRALQRSDDAEQIEALLTLVEQAAEARGTETEVALPAARIAELEAELRAAEAAFAETFARGDMEAFAGFLAQGVVFLSGDEPLRGRAKVVERWTALRGDGEAPFSWRPERVAVDASGRHGLSTGPVLTPDGTWHSSFVSTWTHTAAGWRILLDIGPRCPH